MINKAFGRQPLQWHRDLKTLSATVETPGNGEFVVMSFVGFSMQIEKINAVVTGAAGVTCTCTVRWGILPIAGDAREVVNGGFVVDDNGTRVDEFDNPNVRQDRWIWLETSAITGAPAQLNVTITYR